MVKRICDRWFGVVPDMDLNPDVILSNFVSFFFMLKKSLSCDVLGMGFQYGRIVDIDLKLPPRPPGYCFIEVFSSHMRHRSVGETGYAFLQLFVANEIFGS